MSSAAQYFHDDTDNDDDWRPMDYSEDTGGPPPNIDNDPPPSTGDDGTTPPADPQMDINEMPDIVEPPPPEEKKPRAKKGAKEKQDVQRAAPQENVSKQSKADLEMNAALDRYMVKEYGGGSNAPAATKKSITAALSKPSAAKKSKLPVVKEDVERHQSLLMQIDRYRMSERFKDVIRASGIRLSGIEDCTIEELENVLTRIRTVVGNRTAGGGGVLGTGILMATSVVENMPITQRFADIHGLSAMLAEDGEFADIVEQLSIDYSIMSVLSPEKRLALLMVKSGMKMNSINQMKGMMQSKYAPPAAVKEAPIVSAGTSTSIGTTALPDVKVSPLAETMRSY